MQIKKIKNEHAHKSIIADVISKLTMAMLAINIVVITIVVIYAGSKMSATQKITY